RALFDSLRVESMEMIYQALLYGYHKPKPIILNTS
ncbi:hypothetical protein MNBD_UNCLBAC01-1953, partial [hydrothermal vent metagenome]